MHIIFFDNHISLDKSICFLISIQRQYFVTDITLLHNLLNPLPAIYKFFLITLTLKDNYLLSSKGKSMDKNSLSSLSRNCSFMKFIDSNYSNIEKYKITYDYLTISHLKVTNSTFKNCDFIAGRINDIELLDVDFSYSDILSNEIISAVFKNVNFSGTCIEDSSFCKCLFINCKFENLSIKNCSFENCFFENYNPVSALIELNEYYTCEFKSCKFSGSFKYQIFDNCKYNTVEISPELLGYNFGWFMNDDNTKGIKLEGLDSIIDNQIELFSGLSDYFVASYLFINAMILSLNTDFCKNQLLFMNWVNTLKRTIINNGIIKSNEVVFIKNTIINAFRKHLIAPIIIINLYNQLLDLYKIINNSNKNQENLLLLLNSIYKEIQGFLDKLQNEIKELPSSEGKNIEIYIKYESEPALPFCKILNSFDMGKCVQTKVAYGSFIEWISSPDSILECIKIVISLLGIAVPIIYSNRKDKDNEKNNDSKTNQQVLLPQVLFYNCDNISINTSIHNGCEIINNSSILNEDFSGYTNDNVKYISIDLNK